MKLGFLSIAHFLMFADGCELLGGRHRTTERDQAMKKMLFALAAAAILSGSGLACAEATKQTLAPFGSPTSAEMATAKIEQPQTSTRVALTDDQMDKVSAGHYTGYFHRGWFKIWDGNYGAISGNWQWAYGIHYYDQHVYYNPD